MFKLIKQIFQIIGEYSGFLGQGIKNTLIIAFSGFLIGLLIGCLVATIKVVPKKHSILLKILDKISSVYVTVIRGTPIVVQLLLMYFAILNSSGLSALTIAIIVFGLNSGAYMSEIMRAGILSVDKGQMEAGRTLGLSYGKTMFKIILPQAIKNILPTILNELIALLKETSVAGFITVVDVTFVTQRIVTNEYTALAPYLILAIFYLCLVLIITILARLLERRLRANDNSI